MARSSCTFPTTLPTAPLRAGISYTIRARPFSTGPVCIAPVSTAMSTSIREPDHTSTQTPPFLGRCHFSPGLELHLVNGASLARKMIPLPEPRRAVKPTAQGNRGLYLPQQPCFCPNTFPPRPAGFSISCSKLSQQCTCSFTPTSLTFLCSF